MKSTYTIYTDGGARGNPGPAAIGAVIIGPGIPRKEYAEFLGVATNNEAEYQAVTLAFKKLKHLIGKEKAKKSRVEIFLDSELLAKQLNGEYKVKDKKIQNLFFELWNLKIDFGKTAFKYIPREKNRDADRLVNQALDKETAKLDL